MNSKRNLWLILFIVIVVILIISQVAQFKFIKELERVNNRVDKTNERLYKIESNSDSIEIMLNQKEAQRAAFEKIASDYQDSVGFANTKLDNLKRENFSNQQEFEKEKDRLNRLINNLNKMAENANKRVKELEAMVADERAKGQVSEIILENLAILRVKKSDDSENTIWKQNEASEDNSRVPTDLAREVEQLKFYATLSRVPEANEVITARLINLSSRQELPGFKAEIEKIDGKYVCVVFNFNANSLRPGTYSAMLYCTNKSDNKQWPMGNATKEVLK